MNTRGESGKEPHFTVLLPTYDRPEMLAQAVSSVQAQSDPDWEMVIIDDASPEPVRDYNDHRITVLRNRANRGISYSLNRGFRRATGHIILILADDDAWAPERLAHVRRAHALAPVAVCGVADHPGDSWSPNSHPQGEPARIGDIAWTWQTFVPSAAALSVDRSVFPTFDEDLRACEDIDWGLRLRLTCSRIAVIDSSDFLWRRHDGPRHLNGVAARIAGRQVLLEKYATYLSAHPDELAHHLRQLGYLHLRNGDRRTAARLSAASLRVHVNIGAMKLAVRAVTGRTM